MDRRERFADHEEVMRLAMQGMRASLWTALPGVIVSFNTADPGNVTAVVQPSIQGVVQASDGSYTAVNLPLLPDVPVVFPRGGGCTLTFPIKEGDECLVVFSSRCIDGWWQSGGVQLPMEPRMHDLSDGFAILGPQSKPNKIANISTTAVQLRSDDGTAYLQLNPSSHQIDIITPGGVSAQAGGDVVVTAGGSITADAGSDISATAGGDITAEASGSITATAVAITLNGPVTINGPLVVNGTIVGTSSVTAPTVVGTTNVTFGGKSGVAHTHSGVTTGIGNTGGPN